MAIVEGKKAFARHEKVTRRFAFRVEAATTG